MRFYDNHVYTRLVGGLGNPKPIREVRERLIPLAQGEALEIGVGPGTNFVHYDPARVSKLYALEPNPDANRQIIVELFPTDHRGVFVASDRQLIASIGGG